MVKARSIGTGLGAFFNNPGVIILGALAVVLLFFRGDIRNAFGSLGESLSGGVQAIGDININLPEVTLPSFGGLFGGDGGQFPNLPPGGEVGIPLMEGGINPPEAPTAPTPIDVALSEGATPSDIAGMIGIQPDDPNQDPALFNPPGVTGFGLAQSPQGVPIEPVSQLNLGQEQPLTEAPLGALSLSAIIDKFMVTASQAANIKFIAQEGGDPFAAPGNIFGENPPSVSSPEFQGLSLEEIAAAIGQPISNF